MASTKHYEWNFVIYAYKMGGIVFLTAVYALCRCACIGLVYLLSSGILLLLIFASGIENTINLVLCIFGYSGYVFSSSWP